MNTKIPVAPKENEDRKRFLKKRKLGSYAPGFEPLIPWAYIYGKGGSRD